MNSLDRVGALRKEIDARVAEYFGSPEVRLGVRVSHNGEQALQLLGEFTGRPGKRLRGVLTMAAYEMFGGADHRTALDLALAMELAQSYLLVIDDVMDRSRERRGGPTVHREYIRLMRCEFPGKRVQHEADMAAVIVGELAQHLASSVLNVVDAPAERVLRAERLFHRNLSATGHGQIDDLLGGMGQRHDIAETLAMYVRKTCYYTFINPLQVGATVAGAADDDLAALHEFGVHAGVAFQLQDDDIGMFGDKQISGKSSLDDLREGKMTVLMRHALTHANGADAQTLRAALGNPRVTYGQHAAVQAALERIGSRGYTREEIVRANQAALAVLDAQTRWDKLARRFLAELLASLTSRKG